MKRLSLIATFAIGTIGAIIFTNAIGAKNGQFEAGQVKEIQKIVHDYLVNEPGVLIEASQALQKEQQTKASEIASKAISLNAKQIFGNKFSPSYGNPEGTISIVEFLDYQCSHCKTMSTVVQDVLKTNPNIHFIVKELPIFGGSSNYAARAAIAASKQDSKKFRDFHLKLLSEKKALTNETVLTMAKEVGLDVDKIKVDMEKDDVKDHIKENFKLAQALGLQGTPAFIIGVKDGSKSVYIPGATTKKRIESVINSLSSAKPQ